MTRQQRWQLQKKAEGKCSTCGKELFSQWHCKEHAEIIREGARGYYRKKVGIKVDAPIIKTGRKRIGIIESKN
jgi:hypothetical protein